jgi:hypothetical protein
MKWKSIPSSVTITQVLPATPKSIGRPGVGSVANLALGVLTSLVEAKVSNERYQETLALLQDVLSRIERDNKATASDWKEIGAKVEEIAKMKQFAAGYVFEFLSYGRGSLIDRQALAMAILADELGDKFGYQRTRTWTDVLRGDLGHFEDGGK